MDYPQCHIDPGTEGKSSNQIILLDLTESREQEKPLKSTSHCLSLSEKYYYGEIFNFTLRITFRQVCADLQP